MKLKDILKEEQLIEDSRSGFLGSLPKFSQPTIDVKGTKIQFNLGVGANAEAYGAIVLDFKPKGKNNLELYNNNKADVDKEIPKWVTSKIKMPAHKSEWSNPKDTCRIIVNTNSILKKLK